MTTKDEILYSQYYGMKRLTTCKNNTVTWKCYSQSGDAQFPEYNILLPDFCQVLKLPNYNCHLRESTTYSAPGALQIHIKSNASNNVHIRARFKVIGYSSL